MFTVMFQSAVFGNVSSIEEAVSLAMAVHRSSNVPHVVKIFNDVDCVITFTLKDNEE